MTINGASLLGNSYTRFDYSSIQSLVLFDVQLVEEHNAINNRRAERARPF